MNTQIHPSELAQLIRQGSLLKTTARFVALTLAMNYDHASGHCRMTSRELVQETGLSERAVWNAINAIRISEEWAVTNQGRRSGNIYTPNLDVLAANAERRA